VLRGGYGIFYFLDRGGIDNQFGQQVPFGGSVGYSASNGYRITFTGQGPLGNNNNALGTAALPQPGFPNFNPAVPPAGINVIATSRNNKIPTVQQFNVQWQQQVGANNVFTLGYVGNVVRHLTTAYNYNSIPLGGGTRPFPNLGQINYDLYDGVSNYNSLQVQFNHRTSHGLTSTASYTFSHTLDDSDGLFGFFTPNSLIFGQHGLNYGNSALDQRHVFAFSNLYELPFGRGKTFGTNWGKGLDMVAGGWQVNSLLQLQSGQPFTVQYPDFSGNFSQRPIQTGHLSQPHSISGLYFDPSVFSQPPAGQQGNVGRNSLYGPGFVDLDLSIFKNIAITERVHTQLRGEAFNLTNTPAFTNPIGSLNDPNAGRITGTRQASERQLQIAVRFTF
jgi:hypothetical protein